MARRMLAVAFAPARAAVAAASMPFGNCSNAGPRASINVRSPALAPPTSLIRANPAANPPEVKQDWMDPEKIDVLIKGLKQRMKSIRRER